MTPTGMHEARDGRPPETVDRILVGACGAIWLALIAISVIELLALIDLGRGQHRGEAESGHTAWVLYSIIAVSALILLGAIPLLLRARRTATAGEVEKSEPVAAPVQRVEPRTEKLRVFGTSVDPYERQSPEASPADKRIDATVLQRLWLRGTVSLVAVIGLALVAVSTATYLLATDSTTAAWAVFGVAGVITVAMPAVLVFFQRQLGEAVEEAAA